MMQQFSMFTVMFFLSTGVIAFQTQAQTWCSTHFPDAVLCEDFDGYASGADFIEEWNEIGPCSSSLSLDTDFYSSPPYAGKMNTQQNGDLGYSINTISDAVRNAYGETCTSGSLIGTDLNPLVLELVMNGQTAGKAKYDNSFMTIGLDSVHAPTDWAWSDWCIECGSPKPRFPIICQQEEPAAACPPISTAPDVPALAVGFLAYLDSNPCHCGETGDLSPYNEHLSFFDGHKWYKLRQGLFPGNGDFKIRDYENRIRITIKSSTIKVELTCPHTSEYSWCQITGGYTGPYNFLATGFHVACQLRSSNWTCKDDPSCNNTVGVPGGAVPRYDNIVLRDGICYSQPGACCFADTSCVESVYEGDCLTRGGHFGGSESTCATTACCPLPLAADHDMDQDVDLDDFGWFQACLSGANIPPSTVPCRCAEFDQDDDVDAADLSVFLRCMSGPNIPADPNCTK